MEVRSPQVPIKRYTRALQPYERLEEEWATFNELPVEGMVVCSSGSAALHLALEAFRLPPGSEVLVPDYTMVACARAVTLAGLTPVFVDCGDDLNLDVELVAKEVGGVNSVGVVMAVHVYGRRCDMDALDFSCLKGGDETLIVEDLAEAHGVRPHLGTDAACWSFYRNKVVAGEEGGAVWFRDPSHAALARCLRSMGFTDAHDYTHVARGWNYRMSNLHAQPISESLLAYSNNVYARRAMELLYDAACPAEWRMPARDVPWVYDVRIPGMTAAEQNEIVRRLNGLGIAARHAFKPMTMQEEYQFKCRRVHGQWTPSGAECVTRAEVASREVIYFPLDRGNAGSVKTCFDVCKQVLDGQKAGQATQ